MRLVQLIRAITIVAVIACISILSFSQSVRLKIPILVTDSMSNHGGRTETIYFGVDPNATFCVDESLGEYCMAEPCGPPSYFICAGFINPRGDDAECLFPNRLDFRPFINTVQVDTYLVSFMGMPPLVLRWPINLNLYYDSVKMLLSLFPQGTFINMLEIDSFKTERHIYDVFIIAWGPKGTTEVPFHGKEFPNTFSLQQNYPNPFNPSTVIRYQLHVNGWVSMKVYDVFGREIAKLVDAKKPPGNYDAEWNAGTLPSGVYLYRLQTENYVSTKKMILMH
jgi:hypothetical protein